MTIGMTFFITDPGWRMPVLTRLTPDFHVPHFHIIRTKKREDNMTREVVEARYDNEARHQRF